MCGEGLVVILLVGVGLFQMGKAVLKNPGAALSIGSMFMRIFRGR